MDSDTDKTLYCGNLHPKVTDELLYELFLQAGPVEHVHLATDKEGNKRGFAFIKFYHDVSVPYALNIMDGMRLFDRPLRLQFRPGASHNQNRQPNMTNRPGMSPGSPHTAHGSPSYNRTNSAPEYNQQRNQHMQGMNMPVWQQQQPMFTTNLGSPMLRGMRPLMPGFTADSSQLLRQVQQQQHITANFNRQQQQMRPSQQYHNYPRHHHSGGRRR